MSRRSEQLDEIRQLLASMDTRLGQLSTRVDRMETRSRSSRSHNRTKQAAHLCEAPKEVVKEDQVDRKEEAVLLPTPKEEEGEILSKGEEPVLLLVPKEEEGETRSKEDLPIKIQTKEEVQLVTVVGYEPTPFREFVIKLEGQQCQLVPMTAPQSRELYKPIPQSTPTATLFLIPKEVDRTWQVKNFFFNIMLFCRLVRICRRFVKDRGRKRISHNPRAWAWEFFRPKEAPF